MIFLIFQTYRSDIIFLKCHVQGRSYVYPKTHVRTYLDQNMGRFYHNSDEFLMLLCPYMCVEPILIFDRISDDFGISLS